jgi:hypothetical protein
MHPLPAEAQFLVPEGGDKVDLFYGCPINQPAYWLACTTTLCHSQLYPPSQGLRNRLLAAATGQL